MILVATWTIVGFFSAIIKDLFTNPGQLSTTVGVDLNPDLYLKA